MLNSETEKLPHIQKGSMAEKMLESISSGKATVNEARASFGLEPIARKAQCLSAYVAEDGCAISQLRIWSKRLRFLAVANLMRQCIRSERPLRPENTAELRMCFSFQNVSDTAVRM